MCRGKNDDSTSGMVTGVTVVRRKFLEEHPEAVEAFLEEHALSVDAINSDTATGAALAAAAEALAELLEKEALEKPCGRLSGGMKRRVVGFSRGGNSI